jgi:CspA family cold shock protein
MNGIVKWFHAQKAFGYIERTDGRKLFFRFTDLQFGSAALRKGDEVAFELDDLRLVARARQIGRAGQQGKAA